MEVTHKFIFRSCDGGTLIEIDHLLVIAVHKVNLETLDTHLGVVFHHALHIAVQRPVTSPKHDTHATLFGVVAQMLHINFGYHLHQIGLLVYRPTLIEDNILYAVACGEVDIILIGAIVDARLKIYGNNVGLLVDIFPGEDNFYISAGLNFSESKMRCRSRIYKDSGMGAATTVGGTEYSVSSGDYADICGKYSWNHAQPYIGIGYQNFLFKGTSLYYSVDFGINFMGSGKLSTSSTGNLLYRDSTTDTMKPATEEVMEKSIRKEGRDFFRIADDLCVYPVLQFALGARF